MNNSHMSALRQRHADLESELSEEENRPFPDETLIVTLKKKKLVLKDEIMRDAEPA